ncbi:hypothetical protein ACGFNU_43790 [Spirillospora sp. NPDC048911]|uniref:hypothetical protein n=1 Tax=Spirillospora sp. NPDC048911 TaxID=3364527 RepID=UPI003712BFD4
MTMDKPRINDNSPVPLSPQEITEALRRKYQGTWMIMWSDWEKRFLAYPTWIGGGGYTTKAASEVELERKMAEIEQLSRPTQSGDISPFHQQPFGRQA